ncbi:class I SAM-dependent methyltransferase [Methylocapsa sp. S129]|uniref:class I SAM-dependent methyltransferase n=1 Tax=Methylocapsa sp. S129 TaxID=1641869 RepID=UPI00131AD8F6|nr:class I SAM-dependent methyltransferase [Methylocapsa sp. S129]
MEQRFTFDKIASLYDAARPDYPDALFSDVAALANLGPGDAILEVGCGTGRATQGFARLGLPILALDPGPALLDVARQRLGAFSNVRFAEATFEAWPLEPGAFTLVAAAQSWHWVAPDVRFAKAAAALKPGGFLAVFGNVSMPLPGPLGEAIDHLYARYAPRLLQDPPGDWYGPGGVLAKIFSEAERFGPATHKSYPWTRTHDASSYVDLLRTRSDCQILEPAQRDALTAAVAAAIEAHGGAFKASYEAHLYLAQRAG